MQYARIYLNATAEVIHVVTSSQPITADHTDSDDVVDKFDMEVGDEAMPFKRAKELWGNLEMKGGQPAFKTSAPAELTATKIRKVEPPPA